MQGVRWSKLIELVLDNLFDFAAIGAAAYIVVRGQLDPTSTANISELASWILTILGLIAVSGIWDRNRRMHRIESASKETLTLVHRYISGKVRAQDFFLPDFKADEQLLNSAMRIVFTGITAQYVKQYMHIIEQRLKAGALIQIVLVDPSDANIQQMLARSWGEANVDHYRGIISSTVTILDIMARNPQNKGKIEVGFAPFHPSYCFVIVNPDQNNGVCCINLVTNNSVQPGPSFKLDIANDPYWYNFFLEQFQLLWKNSHIETLPRKSITIQ